MHLNNIKESKWKYKIFMPKNKPNNNKFIKLFNKLFKKSKT